MSAEKTKTIEETYVKKTQLEHIFDIPDTYIGSIENTELETWVYNELTDKIEFRNIKYIPGLYKIFDEILVNATDHHVRLEKDSTKLNKVTMISVNIDRDKNIISILNNGSGLPCVIHDTYKIYIPEMIFAQLLTSTNYDKSEKKNSWGSEWVWFEINQCLFNNVQSRNS